MNTQKFLNYFFSAECIPYALCHAQEINDAVESMIMNDDTPIEELDPMVISDSYDSMFRCVKGTPSYDGKHKLLHAAQILRDWGRAVVKAS